MARPRKPTNVLELSGAFRKDPSRARVDPVVDEPLGDAPAWLTDDELHVWNEIVKCCPRGVLTGADRIALEEMCKLVHRSRVEGPAMPVGERQLLRTYLGQFGMTPADRAKIAGPKKREKNEFDEF